MSRETHVRTAAGPDGHSTEYRLRLLEHGEIRPQALQDLTDALRQGALQFGQPGVDDIRLYLWRKRRRERLDLGSQLGHLPAVGSEPAQSWDDTLVIELLPDEGRDILREPCRLVRNLLLDQRAHGSFDDAAVVRIQSKSDVPLAPLDASPSPGGQRRAGSHDSDHDRDREQMNPGSRLVALGRQEAADVDSVHQPQAEQVGHEKAWTEEQVDERGHGRLARDERAAPDRLITSEQSLEIHARHGADGETQRPQVKDDFPPGQHNVSGDLVPIDTESPDDVRELLLFADAQRDAVKQMPESRHENLQ